MRTSQNVRLAAALLALSSASAYAGQATPADLLMDGDACRLAAIGLSSSQNLESVSKANDQLEAASAKLEADAPDAIRHAKSKSLKAAVKDYYIAASAYCQGPNGLLDNALRAKESALRLEMKLSK